ncbi:MAG: hypothetical protein R2911_26530 [Caldilineaceae bacterium]
MPQKRNPVVLEHLRARLSRSLGYAQTVVTQCHSIPYGDTQDIEDEILPPLLAALNSMRECLTLYTAVFETLELNAEHLAARAGHGFTTATELADALVRQSGLPFRQAHKVTAALVQNAVRDGLQTAALELPHLQTAARAVLGHEVNLSAAQFAQALDPRRFVESRTGIGGVSPLATGQLLQNQSDQLAQVESWRQQAQARLASAEQLRNEAARSFL